MPGLGHLVEVASLTNLMADFIFRNFRDEIIRPFTCYVVVFTVDKLKWLINVLGELWLWGNLNKCNVLLVREQQNNAIGYKQIMKSNRFKSIQHDRITTYTFFKSNHTQNFTSKSKNRLYFPFNFPFVRDGKLIYESSL